MQLSGACSGCSKLEGVTSFVERLSNPAAALCLYGLAPPKQSTSPERLRAIVEAQVTRVRALAPDALVVYDLQDETARQETERPFPFLPTLDPAAYAYESLRDLAIPKIVYRSVARDSRESLSRWLARPADGGGSARLSVFVGAASASATPALSLNDAYELARSSAPDWCLGGIAIAERHARRGDEHERLLRKTAAGCRFFITQAVYDASATKSMLSDYARALSRESKAPVPIILTFSPCGSLKTLELLKWLGISFPRWLENELLDAHDVLDRSIRLCEATWSEVLAFAREKALPIGFNVESVSTRREEVEASAQLFSSLRAMLQYRA